MKIFFGFFNPFFLCVLDKGYNSLEDALLLINKYGVKPEVAAQDMKVELDKLLAALNSQPSNT